MSDNSTGLVKLASELGEGDWIDLPGTSMRVRAVLLLPSGSCMVSLETAEGLGGPQLVLSGKELVRLAKQG
jgi:hypothetical protein